MEWGEFQDQSLKVIKKNTESCIIDGESRPEFCVDTFELNLEGRAFRGLTDINSAAGNPSKELIYDFSLYYA